MRFWKRGVSALAALTLLTAPVLAAGTGVGTVSELESTAIAAGVTLRKLQAVDGSRKQNIHTLTFSVPDSDYMVLPYFGNDLFSRHTLTAMAGQAQSDGYEVVGGINGDFFNVDGTVTGMPVGALIQEDRVICSEDISPNITGDKAPVWQTIGFKRDGTAVIGHLNFMKSMTVVGEDGSTQKLGFTLFNRKLTSNGVHVYTEDYGKSVQNKNPAFAVVLDVQQGKFALDETVVCKVEKILTGVTDVTIPAGKVVLCAYENTANERLFANILRGLKTGQRIDLKLSGGTRWKGVFQAISGPDAVLAGGVVTINPFVKDSNYPSTLVGVKADGTVVFAQIDGRNMGGSAGVSAKQAGEFMKSLGCTDALLFDGGGSSEIVAKQGGSMQVLNKPSDGRERSIGTCLLLVKKNDRFYHPESAKPVPPYGSGSGDTGTTTTPSDGASDGGTTAGTSPRPPTGNSGEETPSENGSTTVPPPSNIQALDYPEGGILKKHFLNRIRGLNKGYTIDYAKDGAWQYRWTLYGKEITQRDADMALDVTFSSEHQEAIEALTSGADGVYLSFAQKSDFPGTVRLRVAISEKFANGAVVQVYGYDAAENKLVRVASDVNVADGAVDVALYRAQDLLITDKVLDAEEQPVSPDAETTPGDVQDASFWWVWIGIGAAVIAAGGGTAVFLILRKRRMLKGINEQTAE